MFELPPLPYPPKALEPWISERTVCLHHDRHQGGYIKNLNNLIRDPVVAAALNGSSFDMDGLESLIENLDPESSYEPEVAAYRNASQAWNHVWYWNSMKPRSAGPIPSTCHDVITPGIKPEMRASFLRVSKLAAANALAAPWFWLILDDEGEMTMTAIDGVETPLAFGLRPLAVCDGWEHAYYLDHPADRSTYVEDFVDRLLNWTFVAENIRSYD